MGIILMTIAMVLAFDVAIFIMHWLHHKIPGLWEFHKVHHSAEAMTPMTVFRQHPVDMVLHMAAVAALTGIVDGVFQHGFSSPIGMIHVAGVNIVLYLFYLFGFNLRHSHIWVSYGATLSRILMSPAQHQIHHSQDPKHYDKNMGYMFAFWDALAGTLYVPETEETLTYGINPTENKQFQTVSDLCWRPVINVLHDRRYAMIAALMLGATVLLGLHQIPAVVDLPADQTVQLNDLTWAEVHDKIEQGTTRAIIPTGGTEQNGAHMVLGKHNYIVRYTAEQIALRLGHTLVAPVVTYVPEGDPETRSGHMAFSGTLSVPDDVFAAVLTSAAKSLKAHGFKTIYLVGDSGGNQAVQESVAEALTAEWKSRNVRVIAVTDYYANNGQAAWLQARGESLEHIGTHAGIRDTSELLSVRPEAIRMALRKASSPDMASVSGVIGDPKRASATYGKSLLGLKIDAAVRQIRAEQGES